ncbi:MAG TPA: cupin domain-containing protein [Limnobacter sp.]|uniref:cupin domain-containing protein n=1 Tax=Limnobacter sp. TaxID=2003368 RepID=UPI002ED93726
MSLTLTSFAEISTPVVHDHPRPDRRERGNPLRSTWNHYERNGVSAGLWACEVGAWRIAFAEGKDEFFHVIEGLIRITNSHGEARTFGAGQACVIPGGFTGLFEVLEPVRKHYVLIDRGGIQAAPQAAL